MRRSFLFGNSDGNKNLSEVPTLSIPSASPDLSESKDFCCAFRGIALFIIIQYFCLGEHLLYIRDIRGRCNTTGVAVHDSQLASIFGLFN